MVFSRILPVLPFIPVAGLIFQAGRQAERVDELFTRVYASETEQKSTRDLLYDIHGKVCAVEQEVRAIAKRV